MNPLTLREVSFPVVPVDAAAPLVRVQPQGLYAYFCRELALKPNTAVLQRLCDVCLLCSPMEPPSFDPSVAQGKSTSNSTNLASRKEAAGGLHPPSSTSSTTEGSPPECCCSSQLDLSQNFLGAEGLRPLLQTIRVVHFFTTLDLSDNVLDSQLVAEIVRYLDGVTSMQTLLLSRNPLISHSGGRHVKAFVAANANVCAVDLSGSSVSGALQNTIHALCLANRRLRQQPELLEEKLAFQRRVRGSHGSSAGSLQPTPLKRYIPNGASQPHVAQQHQQQVASSSSDHRASAARSDSLLVIDASDSGSVAAMPATHTTAAPNPSTTGVLLPPFHHMELPTPGRAAGGAEQSTERDDGGGSGSGSSNNTNQNANGNHILPMPVEAAGVGVSGAWWQPTQLDPLQYVFATALSGALQSPQPGHGGGQGYPSTSAPASADTFAALRLLREVMYETE